MSKRLILLTIGILMLCALSAIATETRVATMGNSGLYLKDDAGIFTYPGTMSMYQKMVIAEHYTNSSSSNPSPFAYPSFRRVGIVMPAWGNGTLAIFAGEDQEDFNVGGAFPGAGFVEPTTRFLVGYGMNTGNTSLGFQADFSGTRQENPNPPLPQPAGAGTTIFTASTWGFGFGLSTPMGELNNLDFGFRIRIGSFEEKLDSSVEVLNNKSDGNTALSFVVRDYYALNDYMNLVPVGALGIASEKNIDYTVAGGTDSNLFKFNTTNLEAGLALQTKPTESSEIIGGAGYRYTKTRTRTYSDPGGSTLATDNNTSTTALPFAFLGLEAQVKNWMHFRLGVEKEISMTKQQREEPVIASGHERDEWKETSSPLNYAVGVAFHAGPVTMDALVENQWINNGPNFLSGESTDDGQLFPRITFVYNFK